MENSTATTGTMTKRQRLIFAIAIFFLALGPRGLFVAVAGHTPPGVDEHEYHQIARNVANGDGFIWYKRGEVLDGGAERIILEEDLPATFRPPGFIWFLGGVYALFGHSYLLARFLLAVISATYAPLTFLICRRVFNQGAAILSAFIVALYPPFILYSVALMTEHIFIALLLLAVYALVCSVSDERRFGWIVLAGLAFGAAELTRPPLIFLLPVLLIWLRFGLGKWKPAVARFAALSAIVLIMVTPWAVRNSLVTGRPMYLDSRAGYNLYIGFNDNADGRFDMNAAITLYGHLKNSFLTGKISDVVMDDWGRKQALKFIHEHPGKAIALTPFKLMHFWNLEHNLFLVGYSYGYIGHIPSPLLIAGFVLLLAPFALITLFACVQLVFGDYRSAGFLLLLALVLYYSAMHAVVFGEARLHFPLVPVLAMLGSAGLVQLIALKRHWGTMPQSERTRARWKGALVAALCCVFIGTWVWGIDYSLPKWKMVLGPNGHEAHLDY